MRTILLFTAVLAVAALLAGQTAMAQSRTRVGTSSGDQVLVPVGARDIALGSSFLAAVTGTEAIYYNPAGLSGSTASADVMFSQMNIIGDVGVSYLAIGANFGGFGHLAFTVKDFAFGDIPLTTEDQPDGTGAVYSPTFLTLGLTYSRALTDRIRAGVSVYLVSETLDRVSQNGAMFDIGVQYDGLAAVNGLMLGVTLRHLGGNMSYDGPGLLRYATQTDAKRGQQLLKIDAASFNVPTSLELGLAYKRDIDEVNSATIAGSFENNNFLDDQYRVGIEYSYKDMLFLRGSYTIPGGGGQDAFNQTAYIYGFAAGAGVKYNAGGTVLRFDYAYRQADVFTGNNVFTVGVSF